MNELTVITGGQHVIFDESSTLNDLVEAAITKGGTLTLHSTAESDPPIDVFLVIAVGEKAEGLRRKVNA